MIDWAKEMGIDMTELQKESPSYLTPGDYASLEWRFNRGKIERAEKVAAKLEARANSVRAVREAKGFKKPESLSTKPVPKKRAKVKRYEFTERQLEIARRVLNGQGSV